MEISSAINRLRCAAKLTQAQLAEIFGVSQQTVGKWESGAATPDIDKLILISKHFDVSLDALILGNDNRVVEEMKKTALIKPQYQNMHDWDFYPSHISVEYQQSVEEGLDIEKYQDLFSAVSRLPKGETKKRLGDILYDIVMSAPQRADYKYTEPSELHEIRALRKKSETDYEYDADKLYDKIYGAWMGRICGCMLGKSVECIRTNELIPFLKETNNYPMHRYIYRSDLTDETNAKYKFGFAGRVYADEIDGMPADDDTNYVVLAQEIVRSYGRDFTPYDVSRAWLHYQPKDAYCTAERVAFCNFIRGYAPPASAVYQNPYREWIGAQIRGDYFGYINPGDPELAAGMAWRDASISHVKNGIYGEMFVAAMLAVAACTDDTEKIISAGLAEIPATSRLYESVSGVIKAYRSGVPQQKCFDMIHEKYDEYSGHGWCHTISNAMIVTASLLYGRGDYGKSICMAVETGFDTDCNGATVGSILGMASGIHSIPEYWRAPIGDKLHTMIFGVGTVKISDRAKMTLDHIIKE